jgi:hypothetical protein
MAGIRIFLIIDESRACGHLGFSPYMGSITELIRKLLIELVR